jgi:hypothetical protein
VLDAFDEWRRAVGVTGPAAGASVVAEESASTARRPSLASHIDRVVARLTALRTGRQRSAAFDEAVAAAVRELDVLGGEARQARGERRARIVDRLGEIDRVLVSSARHEMDEASAAQLLREAAEELAPFGARMAADARRHALDAAFERHVREAFALPVLIYE